MPHSSKQIALASRLVRMPAEWEPHAATWLAWPHERSDWPGRFEPIPWVYAEIIRWLAGSERVRLLVQNRKLETEARRVLERAGADLGKVDFLRFPTDRSWTRDYGPIFIKEGFVKERKKNGSLAVVDFRFNAWAKYPNCKRDDRIAALAARRFGWNVIDPEVESETGWRGRFVLEGGSIDVNGCGSVLTTEECLLSPVQARNRELTKREVEDALRRFLGVRDVLWLGRGIAGDDTHGHVDDVARFVGPRTVVAAYEPDRKDPNHEPLMDNLMRLKFMKDARGRTLEVVTLPMPRPVVFEGQRLPASYANFYIANQVVLVPTFNDPSDRVALATLAPLFRGRQVVGIHCLDMVWGLGTLHCLSHEEPAT